LTRKNLIYDVSEPSQLESLLYTLRFFENFTDDTLSRIRTIWLTKELSSRIEEPELSDNVDMVLAAVLAKHDRGNFEDCHRYIVEKTENASVEVRAKSVALFLRSFYRPATCDTGVTDSSQQVQNLHNALGQRVVKTVNGDANTAIHFLYDQSGQVIAEIDATTGTTLREYIYVNGQQIAIVDDTGTQEEATYFVHNDHLGTPQKITDQTQAIVWDATYKPFGEVEVATAEIENNIRFPGQYADEETGLHYNYFRDYDPSTGRYVESDPIGLIGGNNLFSYVGNNPLDRIDPFGLIEKECDDDQECWARCISRYYGPYYHYLKPYSFLGLLSIRSAADMLLDESASGVADRAEILGARLMWSGRTYDTGRRVFKTAAQMKEFLKRSSIVAQLVGIFATTFTVTASEYCNYGCRK
jgi:RHS repeat-associated protein